MVSEYQKIALFRGLSGDALRALTRHLAVQSVPARTMLIDENDSGDDIYFVLDGRVAVKSFSSTGHEVAYTELASGSFFGEFAALDGRPRSASVETLTATRLARMDSSLFRSCLLQYPMVGLELSRQLVGKVRALTERIFEFSTLPVNIRVRLELLRLARHLPVMEDTCLINPAPSHQNIAARIATHREAVSRELSDLVQMGVIETGRRLIIIRSISRLRAHAGLSRN